jgi:hypothetical protein
MDTLHFPHPKDPPGHTRMLAVKNTPPDVEISLECARGAVLCRGVFTTDDLKNRSTVFAKGRERHRQHVQDIAQRLLTAQS